MVIYSYLPASKTLSTEENLRAVVQQRACETAAPEPNNTPLAIVLPRADVSGAGVASASLSACMTAIPAFSGKKAA